MSAERADGSSVPSSTAVDPIETVREVARQLNLLDATGKLVRFDSLVVIRFILALEAATKKKIQPEKLRAEVFDSLETVAELVRTLG